MPDPIYETSQIEGTPDAFQDGPILAEIARVFNNKREACGLSRIDWSTFSDLFSGDSTPAAGPVAADLDTTQTVRGPGMLTQYLVALELTLPDMLSGTHLIGGVRYMWVDPDTNEAQDLPEEWNTAKGSLLQLKEPVNWGPLFSVSIDVINMMTKLFPLDTPRPKAVHQTIITKKLTYGRAVTPARFTFYNEDVSHGFPPEYVGYAPPSSSTREEQDVLTWDNASLSDETEVIDRPMGASFYVYADVGVYTWFFQIPGYTSPVCVRRPRAPGEGPINNDGVLVASTSTSFTMRVYTNISGMRTIKMQSAVVCPATDVGMSVNFVFDGSSSTLSAVGEQTSYPTFTRNVTAPYSDFTGSISISGFSKSTMTAGEVFEHSDRKAQIWHDGQHIWTHGKPTGKVALKHFDYSSDPHQCMMLLPSPGAGTASFTFLASRWRYSMPGITGKPVEMIAPPSRFGPSGLLSDNPQFDANNPAGVWTGECIPKYGYQPYFTLDTSPYQLRVVETTYGGGRYTASFKYWSML